MTLSSIEAKTWRCLNKLRSFFVQRENFRAIHKSDIYENWNLMFDGFEVDRNLLLFFPSSTPGTQCEHFMSSNDDGDFSVLISFHFKAFCQLLKEEEAQMLIRLLIDTHCGALVKYSCIFHHVMTESCGIPVCALHCVL